MALDDGTVFFSSSEGNDDQVRHIVYSVHIRWQFFLKNK